MNILETLLGTLTGIALGATCGFRVTIPMLGVSIASMTGHMHLAHGFEWLASPVAAISLGVATVAEIAAFYIPWLDHAFDVVAAPLAVAAGSILTASQIQDVSPYLQWTLGIIAGGGAATLLHLKTGAVRALSTATTGGIGNPVVSTAEAGVAITGTFLTIAFGWVAGLAFILICLWLGYKIISLFGGLINRLFKQRHTQQI